MTDREKAIVMAYTGVVMLTGDKVSEYYKYLQELLNRPVYPHEIFFLEKEIKKKAEDDFMRLCAETEENKQMDLTLKEVLLNKIPANRFVLIKQSGWTVGCTYIDHEDLFIHSLNDHFLEEKVVDYFETDHESFKKKIFVINIK